MEYQQRIYIFYRLYVFFHNLLWHIMPHRWLKSSFIWVAGKVDFDNLMVIMRVRNTVNGTTTVSVEIDLELPRGFIAKIKKVYITLENIVSVWTAAEIVSIAQCLIRDPDDISQTAIPVNSVQHDVIAQHQIEFIAITGAAGQFTHVQNSALAAVFDYEAMGVDVVSARNLRFNTLADGTEVDNSSGTCIIVFTWEEVTDADILNLLDIL